MTIINLVERESSLTYRKVTTSGEYAGPCPFCQAGEDRFRLWPAKGRYWCRMCGKQGDAIQFLRDFKQMSFTEAKTRAATVESGQAFVAPTQVGKGSKGAGAVPVAAPTGVWAEQAWTFIMRCHEQLLDHAAPPKALGWLSGRGLTHETLCEHCIGYNPVDAYVDRATWGLPEAVGKSGRPRQLWLPRGVVIPWILDDDVWGIRIRRPIGDPKYYFLPGGAQGLYLADRVLPGCPVMILEGEIDALTVWQDARHLVTPVATGSTMGARRMRWQARMAPASCALVAFDTDAPGEQAADYWSRTLKNARRWRPYWADANELARSGVDIAAWVAAGISDAMLRQPIRT